MDKATLIGMVKRSAHALGEVTRGLGDKATWKPLEKGRSAVDQVAECGLIAGWTARILQEKSLGPVDWGGFNQAKAALDTPEKALAALEEGTAALVAAIEALAKADGAIEVTLPWGETLSLARLPSLVYWNNTYHEGQINYIQVLAD